MKDHKIPCLAAALALPNCVIAAENQLATQYSFLCEGRASLEAAYLNTSSGPAIAEISVAGKRYQLQQDISASGARYTVGDVLWWTKGQEGFLQVGDHVEQKNCVLVSE